MGAALSQLALWQVCVRYIAGGNVTPFWPGAISLPTSIGSTCERTMVGDSELEVPSACMLGSFTGWKTPRHFSADLTSEEYVAVYSSSGQGGWSLFFDAKKQGRIVEGQRGNLPFPVSTDVCKLTMSAAVDPGPTDSTRDNALRHSATMSSGSLFCGKT